jgi:hypothetical protein
MMKENFSIRVGVKSEFIDLLNNHHYLQKIEKRGFRTGVNVVLILNNEVKGVAIFTGFPVPELLVGLYGLPRSEQKGFYELSRFCLCPKIQSTEHNLATWFLAKAIKLLRKQNNVRALLSYADNKYHNGTIYRAYGFKYYGLTAPKKDWKADGAEKPNSRGKTLLGQWVERSRKHRYLITYDKKLTPKWPLIRHDVTPTITNDNKEVI